MKPYGTIEIEDPSTQGSWIMNGQRLKPYLGGEIERMAIIIHLEEL